MKNEAAKNENNAPAFTDEQLAGYKKTVDGAADADPRLWIPVTDSLGWRGRRHRKAAIRIFESFWMNLAYPGVMP